MVTHAGGGGGAVGRLGDDRALEELHEAGQGEQHSCEHLRGGERPVAT